MNVFIILKSADKDASFFIQQWADIEEIDNIYVFRNKAAFPISKTTYIQLPTSKFKKLSHVFRFFQLLRKRKLHPDVIVGIYEIPHGLLAVLTSMCLKKPAIVSITGNPAYAKIRKGLRMKLTLWVLKKAKFITVTGSNSKIFLTTKGIPSDKIYVLPNTMDFSNYNPNIDEVKTYDIVSLGRLSFEKRLDRLINIVYELKKEFPWIKVAIGGRGPEKPHLQKLIADLELEKNIDLLGFIPEEEISLFFQRGKVFVLTSETEGFPRTILQAAACRIPVVSSMVGDINDIVEHNINGFCIKETDNIMEYVYYIRELLTNTELNQLFGQRLNAKVRKQFNHSQATKVWKEIIYKMKSHE